MSNLRGPSTSPTSTRTRKTSSSFTVLSNNLVSNSIFTQPARQGSLYNSTSTASTRTFPNLNSNVEIKSTASRNSQRPELETRPSGGQMRRVSAEVKENSSPRESEAIVFQNVFNGAQKQGPTSPNQSLPTSPTPRRTSSSFAAVESDRCVSNSPFVQPYGAGGGNGNEMGIGRPVSNGNRKFTGSTMALPRTPPSTSTPPRFSQLPTINSSSATTKQKSFRPLSLGSISGLGGSGDETETEGNYYNSGSGTSPGKTVTWAPNETVYVLPGDDSTEDEMSMRSENSTIGSASDESEDENGSMVYIEESNGSIVYHGESDEDYSESAISVDEVMLMVDGAIEESSSPEFTSNGIFRQEIFSEDEDAKAYEQRSTLFQQSLENNKRSLVEPVTKFNSDGPLSPSTISAYLSASAGSPRRGYATSDSSYEDKEEEVTEETNKINAARAFLSDRASGSIPFRPTLSNKSSPARSPISVFPSYNPASPRVNPAPSTFAYKNPSGNMLGLSGSPYSIPSIPERSPFLGLGIPESSSFTTSPTLPSSSTVYTPLSTSSTQLPRSFVPSPAIPELERSDSIVSRQASIHDADTSLTTSTKPVTVVRRLTVERLKLEANIRNRAIAARPALNSTGSTSAASSEIGLESRNVDMVSTLDQISRGVVGRVKGRRSLSAGDADRPDAELIKKNSIKKEITTRFSFLDDINESSVGFQSAMENVLERVPYRIYTEYNTVYASDGAISTANPTLDSPGKAMRKKRNSDVHGTTFVTSGNKTPIPGGKVFAKKFQFDLENLPFLLKPTYVKVNLTRGASSCFLGDFKLSSTILIPSEVDLNYKDDLEFNVEVTLDIHDKRNEHLLPTASNNPPSLKGKSSISKLRGLMSSPKKYRANVTPPHPILSYLNGDILTKITINYARDAGHSKNTLSTLSLPLPSSLSAPNPTFIKQNQMKGKFNCEIFYLPAITGIDLKFMPMKMKDVTEGIRLAHATTKVQKEGIMNMIGGDCFTWKRRRMTLRGNLLIPYSEITKTAFVEYDLSLATGLRDLNTSKTFDDEDTYRADRAFAIDFKDESEIRFSCYTELEKLEWMTTLNLNIGVDGGKKLRKAPAWAITLVKLQGIKKDKN